MPLTPREKRGYATAGIGAGLVVGGAQAGEAGIQRGLKLAGRPHREGRPKFPGLVALRESKGVKGAGKARALYFGGNAARTVGTVGVLAGGADVYRGHRYRKARPNIYKGVLAEGIRGNVTATKEKLEGLTEKKPLGALAIPTAIGAGGGIGGSFATHAALNRVRRLKGTKARPGVVALGSLAGMAASTKVSNEALKRTYPDYRLTPTGVKRRKKAPVRPSSQAAHFDQRDGGARFRVGVVPSDVRKLDTNYPGYKMTSGQKRAAIYGAGSVPLVGDFAAAATAGKLAPPEQRKQAARTQLAGNLGGSLVGGAIGGVAAGELARRNQNVQGKLVSASERLDRAKARALKPVTDRLPKRTGKPSALGAAMSSWRSKLPQVPGKARLAARYPGKVGVAAGMGALGGQVIGGQSAGYKATSINLERERRRNAMIGKALVVINNAPKPTTTPEQERRQIKRKKKMVAATAATSALGLTGLGTFAGSKLHSNPVTRTKLGTATVGIGALSGGIGSYGGFKRVAAEHGDIRRQEKELAARREIGKSERIRNLKGHRAMADLSELERYRRATGLRFKNKEYTAALARQMKARGYDRSRPVHVQVWNGKDIFIDDGAHRMWAADMAGVKRVPIKITRHTGRNPRKSSGRVNQVFDDVRTSQFHRQRRKTMNLSDRELALLAYRGPRGWQAEMNRTWAARGEKRANSRGRLVKT